MNTPRAGHPSRLRSPRKVPNSTWAEIRTAHASGIGLREIARSAGIPAGTVLARAKREGWTRSVRDAKALGVRTPAPAVSVATAAAVTMAERGLRHVERVAGIVERTLPAVEKMKPGAILDRIEDFDRLDKVARRTFGLDKAGSGVVSVNILTMGPIERVEDYADAREIEASGNAPC